jgi:hypothetical protein
VVSTMMLWFPLITWSGSAIYRNFAACVVVAVQHHLAFCGGFEEAPPSIPPFHYGDGWWLVSSQECVPERTVWSRGCWRPQEGGRRAAAATASSNQETGRDCHPECIGFHSCHAPHGSELCAAPGICFANEGIDSRVVHSIHLLCVSGGGNHGGNIWSSK